MASAKEKKKPGKVTKKALPKRKVKESSKPKAKTAPKAKARTTEKAKAKAASKPKAKPALKLKKTSIKVKPVPKTKVRAGRTEAKLIRKQKTKTTLKAKKVSVAKVASKPKVNVKVISPADFNIEQKLRALYNLQTIDSQIDSIQTAKGELPQEVQNLEIEVAGLDTLVKNIQAEIKSLENIITAKNTDIKKAENGIKNCKKKKKSVRKKLDRNSLTEKIESKNIDIQHFEKRTIEYQAALETKTKTMSQAKSDLKQRKADLKRKQKKLDGILVKTEKEEKRLKKKSRNAEKAIEERLLVGYNRIRKSTENGLAVVSIEGSTCGGCFNQISPQRQLDFKRHKKIIVCEHCGRILVGSGADEVMV